MVEERLGVAAEFAAPEQLARAVSLLTGSGAALEAYSPYPVPAVERALGLAPSRLSFAVFGAGGLGALGAYLLPYWISAIDYPLNVGALPLHVWPAFVPISFEAMILGASLTAFLGVLLLARLPRLWHPVFEIDGFESAASHAFWLTASPATT